MTTRQILLISSLLLASPLHSRKSKFSSLLHIFFFIFIFFRWKHSGRFHSLRLCCMHCTSQYCWWNATRMEFSIFVVIFRANRVWWKRGCETGEKLCKPNWADVATFDAILKLRWAFDACDSTKSFPSSITKNQMSKIVTHIRILIVFHVDGSVSPLPSIYKQNETEREEKFQKIIFRIFWKSIRSLININNEIEIKVAITLLWLISFWSPMKTYFV